jgi:hypothetical protein
MLNKNFLKFFLNFALGLVVLTGVFHYLASLPVEKSFFIAVVLSLLLDTAYILDQKVLKRKIKREKVFEREGRKLTWRDIVLLSMISLVCLIFGTLGIHHVLVLPLLNGLLIAVILTILVDFAYIYVCYVKKWKKGGKVYSIKQFLLESFFALLIFLPTYFSGIDLLRSLAIALYIYVIIHWYYNYKPHVYIFPKKFLIFRSVLVFFATFLGWFTLVKVNPILCFLIAVLTTFMLEIDRRSSVKLAETLSFEEMEERSKGASALFQPLGLIYGMLVGVMTASNIYGSWYFAWWSLELYRLAYIFTPAFLTISALISWIYVKSKKSIG